MASYPNDLKYTKNHEWVRVGEPLLTIGLTEVVVERLGEITFVELPYAGELFKPGQLLGRASSPTGSWVIRMPMLAQVNTANGPISEAPEPINAEPYGDGSWIVRIEPGDRSDLDDLMDAAEYEAYVAAGDE